MGFNIDVALAQPSENVKANSNAMWGRQETIYKAPRFFSRLPHTPSTLFPLPLSVQQIKIKDFGAIRVCGSSSTGAVEGKSEGGGGGAGENPAEAAAGVGLMGFSPPPLHCIAVFLIGFLTLLVAANGAFGQASTEPSGQASVTGGELLQSKAEMPG